MATAKIIFQQNGDGYLIPTSRDDLVLGLPVTMLNQNNTGAVSWAWVMIDKPTGSSATIASPTSSTTTFTPDIVGTYLIHLSVNAGAVTDQRGAAVKTANLSYRIPAATETTEFDGYRGWATATNAALKVIDDGYTPPSAIPSLQTVYNTSNPAVLILNPTNNGIKIQDANAPIGSNLFEVDAYGGATKYFSVNQFSSNFTGQLLQVGGKVGLGTITPGAGYTNLIPDLSVHVVKTGHNMFLIDATSASSDSGLVFYTTAAGNDAALFLDESDSQKFKLALGAVDSDANRNTNTVITVQQDGAVGIGITSPTSRLHVAGSGHFTGNVFLDSGFTAGAAATMGTNKLTLNYTPTVGTDATNKTYVDAIIGGAGNLSGTLTTPRIPYATATNTLSDSANLIWDNTNSILKVQNTWIGNRVIGSEADNQSFKIFGGQVGGVAPGGEVRLGGSARVDTSINIIQFNQNGTEIARFQGDTTNGNAGSLGINNVDPRFKLDVNGSTHLNTTLLVGSTPTNNPSVQSLVTNQASNPFFGLQGHATNAQNPTIAFYDGLAAIRAQIVSSVADGYLNIDYDGYPGIGSLRVRNNINGSSVINVDSYGVTSFTKKIVVDGYAIDPGFSVPALGDSLVYNGTAFAPTSLIVPLISDNSNLLLTTTSPTNVISYTPTADGDFVVFVYYRVVTATTTLTLDITWTDGTGAQTFNAVPMSAQLVGSYSVAPLYITAKTTAPIVVTATAATANQIYVSASSMSLITSVNTGAEPAVAEEADIFSYLLTTTGLTNVLAFTPPINENYFVYIYYRVANATTNVTIDLTFNDGGGAQTLNILPLAAKTVGSYSVSPVYISATTAAPIIVKFTAGTANNVYVSATIMMV